MNKKTAFAIGFVFLFLASVAGARALESTGTVNQAQNTVKTQAALAKCAAVEKRVANRIKNFDHQKEKHLASYEKTKAIIGAKMDRLTAKGYDVAKLEADLKQYDILVEKFKTDYTTYITLLKETQAYTCGKSEGEFKAKLQAARDQLKVVHQDAVAIRTFWAKTMRLDFIALKDQKPVSQDTEKTTETNTNTSQGE